MVFLNFIVHVVTKKKRKKSHTGKSDDFVTDDMSNNGFYFVCGFSFNILLNIAKISNFHVRKSGEPQKPAVIL